ncbi:MAG: thioredoxin domain-containing protein, partial [Thermodesulforhabdaceae bacterium]
KMLYDQALVPMAYLEAWQLTKNPAYKEIITQTLDFVLEELTFSDGGFYSAQDADVDGKEGEYYLWTRQEIIDVLGEDNGVEACKFWGVEGSPNFEGKFIPYRADFRQRFVSSPDVTLIPTPENILRSRDKLFSVRKNRHRPATDDKIITAWNGLMIGMYARAGNALVNDLYVSAAERAARFILSQLMDDESFMLRRSYRDGEVKGEAVLEDYAFLIQGLMELFFATSDSFYLKHAQNLTDRMISLFWDIDKKGFHFIPETVDDLPIRSKDIFDGATPSGNSVAFEILIILDQLLGSGRYEEMAREMLEVFLPELLEVPAAYTHFICGVDRLAGPLREVVILPDESRSFVDEVKKALARLFLPGTIHFVVSDDSFLSSVLGIGERVITDAKGEEINTTMIQICSKRTCLKPVDAKTFLGRLEKDQRKVFDSLF